MNGDVSETLLSGQTVDISPFVELKWYNSAKIFSPGATFPNPKEEFGQWFGPTIDIGQ